MKLYRNIVGSSEEPVNINDLWLNDERLRYFDKGEWQDLRSVIPADID